MQIGSIRKNQNPQNGYYTLFGQSQELKKGVCEAVADSLKHKNFLFPFPSMQKASDTFLIRLTNLQEPYSTRYKGIPNSL